MPAPRGRHFYFGSIMFLIRFCRLFFRLLITAFPLCFAAGLLHSGEIHLFVPPVAGASPAAVKLREAFAALKQNKLPEAEAGFQTALRLDPGRVESLIGLAEVSRERRQPAEEEAWLKRALGANGGTPVAYRSWAHYMAANNRLSDAETAFRKAATIDPASTDALVEWGDMDLAAGKPGNAAQVYREALARRQDSYEAHLGLGSALAGTNNLNAAVSEFRQAAQLRPAAPAPAFTWSRLRSDR